MRTAELQRLLNQVKDARKASNWQGMFSAEVRQSTVEHRKCMIAEPLDEVIRKMQKELDSRSLKRDHRRTTRQAYRLPYKED